MGAEERSRCRERISAALLHSETRLAITARGEQQGNETAVPGLVPSGRGAGEADTAEDAVE